jgi:hypothetical protein
VRTVILGYVGLLRERTAPKSYETINKTPSREPFLVRDSLLT